MASKSNFLKDICVRIKTLYLPLTYKIIRCKKYHTIREALILSAAIQIAETMF